MKKIIALLIFIFLISSASFAQINYLPVDSNAGDFKFEEETYNFGNLSQNKSVSHDFHFTNIGKEPIVVTACHATCGCTSTGWPKEPVNPGKTGIIHINFNASHQGIFNHSFTVISNAKTPSKNLNIIGYVEAEPVDSNAGVFKFEEETWDFGDVPQNKADLISHDFKFTNTGNYPIRINDCHGDALGKWPLEPILPGQTGIISVRQIGNLCSRFSKTCTVIIISNTKIIYKELHIKGNVIAAPVEQTTPKKQSGVIQITPR